MELLYQREPLHHDLKSRSMILHLASLLNKRNAELIEQILNEEGFLYLACNKECTFSLQINQIHTIYGHVKKVCVVHHYILGKMFIRLDKF